MKRKKSAVPAAWFTVIILIGIGISIYTTMRETARTPAAAIEKVRTTPVGRQLAELPVEGGELLFFLKDTDNNAQQLGWIVSAEYVKKSLFGWKWGMGGGHTVSADSGSGAAVRWSKQLLPADGMPAPLLFGVLQSKDVSQVVARSTKNGAMRPAHIVDAGEGTRLWVIWAGKADGDKFTVMLLAADGRELDRAELDEENRASSSAGSRSVP